MLAGYRTMDCGGYQDYRYPPAAVFGSAGRCQLNLQIEAASPLPTHGSDVSHTVRDSIQHYPPPSRPVNISFLSANADAFKTALEFSLER